MRRCQSKRHAWITITSTQLHFIKEREREREMERSIDRGKELSWTRLRERKFSFISQISKKSCHFGTAFSALNFLTVGLTVF